MIAYYLQTLIVEGNHNDPTSDYAHVHSAEFIVIRDISISRARFQNTILFALHWNYYWQCLF